MNTAVSKNALIKRIRRLLRHWNWFLVVARGDWYQNDQRLGSYYVIDSNGNVMEHHCDLLTLARGLGGLGEWEIVEGCNTPPAEVGRATEVVEPVDSIVAEVARILPLTLGRVEPIQPQVSNENPHRIELKDAQGRVWFSAKRVKKVRYEW